MDEAGDCVESIPGRNKEIMMGAIFVFSMGMLFGFLMGIVTMSLLAINGRFEDEDGSASDS